MTGIQSTNYQLHRKYLGKEFWLVKNQWVTVASFTGNIGKEIPKLQTLWKIAQCSQACNP